MTALYDRLDKRNKGRKNREGFKIILTEKKEKF